MTAVDIVESYLCSKSGGADGGEDRLVCGPRFFGVIDGATDRSGADWGGGRTGGAALAELLARLLSEPSCPLDPQELVGEANARILTAAEQAGVDLSVVENGADVGFAAYVPARRAVYHIHDCQFAIVNAKGEMTVHTGEKLIDQLMTDVRLAVVGFCQRQGIDPFAHGADIGLAFTRAVQDRQPEIQNIDPTDNTAWFGLPRGLFSYRTLNGRPTQLDITPVPGGTREIILASDGFPQLRPTLDETLALLKSLQGRDPHCLGELRGTKGLMPGNASYDDLSFLRIELPSD